MREVLYERILILQDSGVISEKVAEYTKTVVDYILSEIADAQQDKVEMFITHLAMAGKRAEEGIEENPVDADLLEQTKKEAVFSEAVVLRDRILEMTDIEFPETEKDFLSIHLCNLMM